MEKEEFLEKDHCSKEWIHCQEGIGEGGAGKTNPRGTEYSWKNTKI